MAPVQTTKMSNFRWVICALLFLATTVNYMDRQVLSLTWKDFIAVDFHWSDADYGTITGFFSLFYAIANLFAGKFIDWMGTKKGYLIAIFVWSTGAVLHAGCGWAAMVIEGYDSIEALRLVQAGSDAAVAIATISVWLFLSCRLILAVGEAGNFPAAIKATAEYFPAKDRAFSTSIFNSGASVGALAAPATCWLVPGVGKWHSSSSVCWVMFGWACGCGSMRSPVITSASTRLSSTISNRIMTLPMCRIVRYRRKRRLFRSFSVSATSRHGLSSLVSS